MADPSEPHGDNQGALSKSERDHFRRRLDDLGEKLQEAEEANEGHSPGQSHGNAMGIAMRMGVEFVVAVLIGGAIGWQIDAWLGTTPILLFIFLIFGFVAGTLNVIRAAKRLENRNNGQDSISNKPDED